ncbi:hypothetical protein [Zooshikella sp. RANM57]|uniref:hypothetical protein n=1 Tax=Zooshikella sp. RANM57 TaxID=3425863 RepID=UPI003D6DF733
MPRGPEQQYREENVICPSWCTLDRMSEAALKNIKKIAMNSTKVYIHSDLF